jgi:transcriptional regulator with XRE-family HTH domain
MTHRNVLREARLGAGLTQAGLARRLGTTQSAVARWESGVGSPRIATLERIARACKRRLRIALEAPGKDDRDQILERLRWTPRRRLDYLRDMIAFERRAHGARARRTH